MELLQLRYFYESAKNENFAKTAEKFIVPPSSVSASIKRLEEELGCKLFDRQSNRISLNENGRLLQNSIGVIFKELDTTVERLRAEKPLKTEIRMLILASRDYVSGVMLEYQKAHPNVNFVAMFDINNGEACEFDIIVDKENSRYTDYRRLELGSYPVCFMAVPDHPLVGRELTMTDLRNEQFITLEFELGANSTLFDCCKNFGFYPEIVFQTNDRQCFTNAATRGIGIGLWLKSPLAPAPDGLVELNVTDLQIRSDLYLYYKNNLYDEQILDFVKHLASAGF